MLSRSRIRSLLLVSALLLASVGYYVLTNYPLYSRGQYYYVAAVSAVCLLLSLVSTKNPVSSATRFLTIFLLLGSTALEVNIFNFQPVFFLVLGLYVAVIWGALFVQFVRSRDKKRDPL